MKRKLFLAGLALFLVFLSSQAALAQDEEEEIKTLFDETKTIQDGQMWSVFATFQENVEYSVDMEVTSGNAVDLLVMDEVNYAKYETAFTGGGTAIFTYYSSYSSLNVKSKSYTIELIDDTLLYIVIENANFVDGGASGGGSVDISLVVTYIASAPGFGFLLVLLALPAIILILKKRR